MAATVTGPRVPTRGATLLQAFLKKNGLTQLAASEALRVSDPTIHDWVQGTKRPRTHHREAIAVWTNGEVPTEAWLRDDERASMKSVQPFTPPPPANSGTELADEGRTTTGTTTSTGTHGPSS